MDTEKTIVGAGESSRAPDGSAQIELLTQVHDILIEIVNSRVRHIGTFTAYLPQLDRLQCDMLCAAVGAIIEATPNDEAVRPAVAGTHQHLVGSLDGDK